MHEWKYAVGFLALCVSTSTLAATFDITETGDPNTFSTSGNTGGAFPSVSAYGTLSGPSPSVTVSQGDTINNTVTFSTPYTVGQGPSRTDTLEYLTGSSFPDEDSGVTGNFTFFDGGVQVATFNYVSTTKQQLASFTANFFPSNRPFTFDSFTNDFVITQLATPATIDGSAFQVDLVSNAVPEPGTWALMLIGVGAAGATLRRSRRQQLAA